MKKLTKDPINKKNPNTYMFTKHIQTYIHTMKKNSNKQRKNLKARFEKNLNLKFHVFYPSLAQKQG
jgi:hypothetical protein